MSVNTKKNTHGIVAFVLIISDRNTTTLILFILPSHPTFLEKNAFHIHPTAFFESVMLHFVFLFFV